MVAAEDEHPLDDREDRAADENHHRRHQRTEEAILAVAEGMRLVGTALAEREREEEEDLVQAVGRRVRRLGEQGARAREDAAGQLRHGDEEVRRKSEQDRLAVLRLHPSRAPAAFAGERGCPDPGGAKPRAGLAARDPGYHAVVPSSSTRPEKRLDEKRREARACRRCDLWRDATSVVFGEGPVPARVMLVGEQPGDVEDRRCEPFVGPAGRLLREVLGEVGLREKDVYLTNAVKHFKWRPKGTRRIHDTPNWTEVKACSPWLHAELELVRPKVLVCLGRIAAQALVGRDARVTALRGRVLDVPELTMPVVVTFRPSAVLRAGDERRRLRASWRMISSSRAPSPDRHDEVSKSQRVGSSSRQATRRRGETMDSDRVEGKTKQLEGEAQEGWGKLKDTARDVKDDVEDALDRTTTRRTRRTRSSPADRAPARRGDHEPEGSETVPPRGVKKGSKRARQYEHIKDSLLDEGKSEDTAEEIAARTVNKERARHGEAKESSRLSREDISSGRRGGLRSHRKGPRGRTRDQLYEEAREKGVKGRSKMTKAELARAVGGRS